MEYFIITGASRGLGNSLCKMLAVPTRTLICISRNQDHETLSILNRSCSAAEWIEIDFLDYHALESRIASVLSKFKYSKHDKLFLINNAGQLSPIGELAAVPTDELLDNISINLIAPMILSKIVLNFALSKKLPLFVVNISSPSAEIPKANWVAYGLSKSGLNYLTAAIASEYKDRKEIKIISFYPGIMDTNMRKENLAARPLFKKIFDWMQTKLFNKPAVKVISADEAARKLIKVINSTSPKNGAVIDGQKLV